jgi:hypothetical protein
MNLEAAAELGIDGDQVRGVLAAIAPIVGTARIVSATGKIVQVRSRSRRFPSRARVSCCSLGRSGEGRALVEE